MSKRIVILGAGLGGHGNRLGRMDSVPSGARLIEAPENPVRLAIHQARKRAN